MRFLGDLYLVHDLLQHLHLAFPGQCKRGAVGVAGFDRCGRDFGTENCCFVIHTLANYVEIFFLLERDM